MKKMSNSLGRGFEFTGLCLKVLWLDKKLVVFPFFSILALAALYGNLFGTTIKSGEILELVSRMYRNREFANNPVFWIDLFALYFATSFIIIFFNSCVIYCVNRRLQGETTSIFGGFGASFRVIHLILAWVLFATTVKIILDALGRVSGVFAQLLFGGISIAWNLATFFSVPVLVMDRVGPIEAMRRSAKAFARTWGETLGSDFGLGSVLSLIGFFCLIPGATGYEFLETAPEVAFRNIAISAVLFLLLGLLGMTLNSILRALLYVYAVQGHLPGEAGINEAILRNAFKP